MGIIRIIFALAVLFDHANYSALIALNESPGLILVGSENAVKGFYIISGFLISYILVEKKTYSNLKNFYLSRYLRLYPIYFIIAILSFFAHFFYYFLFKNDSLFNTYFTATIFANMLLVLSNIFIFFQDWLFFLGIENNKLVFTREYLNSETVIYKGLLVPQAWTLGLELTFYIIAPFILFKKKIILSILILSACLKAYFIHIKLGANDPWSYRFFPLELSFFLIGSLSHQILMPFLKKVIDKRLNPYSKISTAILLTFTLFYSFLPLEEEIKKFILFFLLILLMPLLFLFQNNNKIDNYIGNLSYPIYISHILVINSLLFFFNILNIKDSFFFIFLSTIISIIVSIILNKIISAPIEKIRNKFKN